jgi:hypothetical protein
LYSSLISKIEKARRYAQERDRVTLLQFKATFRGEHSRHELSFDNGTWTCTCHFFASHGTCSHTMALEQMLGEMLPAETVARG